MSGIFFSISGKVVNIIKSQMKSSVTVKEFNVMGVKVMDILKLNVLFILRSRGKDFLYVGLMIQRVNKKVILTEM